MRAIPPGAHVNEFGGVGSAARPVECANHGIDVPVGVAHATERHVLGELESEMIAKIGELSTADLLRSDQTLVGKVAPLRNGFEVAHRL
jgi:hypothetical protein